MVQLSQLNQFKYDICSGCQYRDKNGTQFPCIVCGDKFHYQYYSAMHITSTRQKQIARAIHLTRAENRP